MFRHNVSLREAKRLLHAALQFDGLIARITGHCHVQGELVVIVEFGMNRDQVHPRGHHFFKVFQHTRPGKCLALDQLVQELRIVAGGPVFGTIEKFFRLPAHGIAGGDFTAQL